MNIIILGANQIGCTLAETLTSEANDITVVDPDADKLRELKDRIENGKLGEILNMRAYRMQGAIASCFSDKKPAGEDELAYQNALAYAKDRLQGRDITGVKNPDELADPIIVHPDVRRNLMDQKCFSEGSRALILWGASIIDKANRNTDSEAEGLIGLLTPVIKGFLTDKGFDMTIQAQQIYGGHGYIEEWGMSQFARDARIAMIYEGANGIQALDLVGRKLPQNQGKNMMAFFTILKTYLTENQNKSDEFDKIFLEPMKSLTKSHTLMLG